MADRIKRTRQSLVDELHALHTPGDWSHILRQSGMFTYSGLTARQCKALLEEHHVYLPDTGRIALPGILPSNVKRVAALIDNVVRQYP